MLGLNCLAQVEANLPGVLAQRVEGLHQMRVGLRRLRALFDMFRDLAPLPAQLKEGLDWLSGELGATRDWDVLADTTLPAIDGIHIDALQAAARELDENDAPARHRVRIAAKKARYAAEFFRDLLPRKEVKAAIKCLSGLQDRLGHLNDLAVAGRLLPVLENGGHAHDGAFACGWVGGSAATAAHGLRAALGKVARLKLAREIPAPHAPDDRCRRLDAQARQFHGKQINI